MNILDGLSIFLGLSVFTSGFLLLAYHHGRNAQGPLKLPVHSCALETGVNHDSQVVSEEIENAITSKDLSEGEVVNSGAFWKQMRVRKLVLLVFLTSATLVQGLALGWSLMEGKMSEVLMMSISLFSSVYTVILALCSLLLTDHTLHWRFVLYLTALTVINVGVLAVQAYLYPVYASATPTSFGGPQWLMTSSAVLYFLAALLAARTPSGPALYFPLVNLYPSKVLAGVELKESANVSGRANASPWDLLFMSYTSHVAELSETIPQFQITDLPILPASMRACVVFTRIRMAFRSKESKGNQVREVGDGWALARLLASVNASSLVGMVVLAVGHALLCYTPMFFLSQFLLYLQNDPDRQDTYWGWMFWFGLTASDVVFLFSDNHIQYAAALLQSRIRVQLNSTLFAKTLTRKDSIPVEDKQASDVDDDDFSNKAQILTLMTSDVDRVSQFMVQLSTLIGSPMEIVLGFLLLLKLLGPSTFLGIAAMLALLPINHYAGGLVGSTQQKLMAARDERLALTNEVLVGIRMLKFMAWEKKFEQKVLELRAKELKYQRRTFWFEMALNSYWSGAPILVLLLTLWHFTIVRGEALTPAIAFAVISVLQEMRWGLNALPEMLISLYQSRVSLRRLERYLHTADVTASSAPGTKLGAQSATIGWPRSTNSDTSSGSTPHRPFSLEDLTIHIPEGKFTLVCGKIGSGKTLLLHGLLGEADVLVGQVFSSRSPQDTIFKSTETDISDDQWILPETCAYVSQVAWLENASIKDNILFGLPLSESRYRKTLQVCALTQDLQLLEDGDMTEIGERGINMSGGQKARITLARAVYSRASILLLDDVLAAVDAQTARMLYHRCLRGELLQGRTTVLVSHHIQLCAKAADHIILLEKGRVRFQGSNQQFNKSGLLWDLVSSVEVNQQTSPTSPPPSAGPAVVNITVPTLPEEGFDLGPDGTIEPEMHAVVMNTEAARVLVESESRGVGDLSWATWKHYFRAAGGCFYWASFAFFLFIYAVMPIVNNKWLEYWSNAGLTSGSSRATLSYIGIYAIILAIQLLMENAQSLNIYHASLRASSGLYQKLLSSVLFARLRFHDTVSKGRLLSRFGTDFGGLDSRMADLFRRITNSWASAVVSLLTIATVGGLPFVLVAVLLLIGYWNVAKAYRVTSREVRRIEAGSQAPLYTIYGDAISGAVVLRAFGATGIYMRKMLRFADVNTTSFFWTQAANQWVTLRLNLISGLILATIAAILLLSSSISAALAGFTLTLATGFTNHIVGSVRGLVILEQTMVAVERISEFSDLPLEDTSKNSSKKVPSDWPSRGNIVCEDLHVAYSPDLPNVLHDLKFTVAAGEKVGIVGRTGSGKTTLALSFLRFTEAHQGRILVDDVDIALLSLFDLRTRITIIPQDPVILSGTLRSALDVSNEYSDAEIYSALRRVHLIDNEDSEEIDHQRDVVFRNLDSLVAESGQNFSSGEKQLICMARAILKQSKVLIMDEATASVDFATDQLISRTIREAFANSTILTIAHRLRTVMTYDKVMVLDTGRLVEFDSPAALLDNPQSKFFELCQATGEGEFGLLRNMLERSE